MYDFPHKKVPGVLRVPKVPKVLRVKGAKILTLFIDYLRKK